MKHYAEIEDGFVRSVVELPSKPADFFPLDEALKYVACDASVGAHWAYSDGVFTRPEPIETPLDQIKIQLKSVIDIAAEDERLKYITPGHGQAMTYQQKVAEAQAFKAATDPQVSDYPILSSEVGITADTLDEVANIVLAAFAQWQQIGAMIESIRLGGKRDIDAAEDEAAARAIVDTIVWPSAQVQA